MKIESKYLKTGFRKHKKMLKWYHISVAPLIIILSGSVLNFFYHDTFVNTRHLENGSIVRDYHFSPSVFVLLIIIAYTASWLIYCYNRLDSQRKPIILSFDFNDEKEVLTIKTRSFFNNSVNENKIPYKMLRLESLNSHYDPISNSSYEGMYVYNGNKRVGILLQEHFSWHTLWLKKVLSKLATLKKD